MSVILRTGLYGNYYGNDFNSSNPLNLEQMKTNAIYLRDSLVASGFTVEAVSAMLGNMEIESSINPGRWENDDVGDLQNGYGLVQWTPATNYINWLPSGYDASIIDNQVDRINYEVNNNLQWIPTTAYPYTFEEFKHSTESPYDLALMFLANYERPAEPNQPIRGDRALYWFEFLENHPYGKTKKSKFKFVLYARKIRERY